ncbi:MAG TPA: hypothetical protein VFA45_00680 [Actinomycetes bacterium]|jgi:hypothetical protein|nr:hypothetical protein [Actinomycetes bacterium]
MPQDPKQPPRVLSEDESVPDWFVRDFCDDTIMRFRAEAADLRGRDPVQEEQARLRVVDEMVGRYHQRAKLLDWTVGDRRIRQLASDAIGLCLEFQHDHGYEPMAARWAAVRECAEGEQARELIAEQEREFAAEAASQGERTAEAEPARVDRDEPRTRGGGER